MCFEINISALQEVKVRKYFRFLSCIFRIHFVKKDWGYLQKTLITGLIQRWRPTYRSSLLIVQWFKLYYSRRGQKRRVRKAW